MTSPRLLQHRPRGTTLALAQCMCICHSPSWPCEVDGTVVMSPGRDDMMCPGGKPGMRMEIPCLQVVFSDF